MVRWTAILGLVCVAACTPRKPPTTTPPAPNAERIDEESVLVDFLEGLSEAPEAGDPIKACRRRAGVAAQADCVMEVLTARVTDPEHCADGVPYLTTRMVARHFVCVAHGREVTRAVVDDVLGLLEQGAERVAETCPEERGYLAFTADVSGVLGLAAWMGAPADRVGTLARRWRVPVRETDGTQVASLCRMQAR